MATDKKSFLLYCDLIHTVEQLTDEQAGDLFKHILRYVNDQEPQTENVITLARALLVIHVHHAHHYMEKLHRLLL